MDPAFGGSDKISLQLVRLQGRCAWETRDPYPNHNNVRVPIAFDDQRIMPKP